MLSSDTTKDGKLTLRTNRGPQRAKTAHFGFTMIRVQRLLNVPKPWFKNIPGIAKDGLFKGQASWRQDSDGRIEADIHFWQNFERAGLNLYVMPTCSIGHIEQLVAVPDMNTGYANHVYGCNWPNGAPVRVSPKEKV